MAYPSGDFQAVDIPLKLKTLERFVKACDTDKNGEIDYRFVDYANTVHIVTVLIQVFIHYMFTYLFKELLINNIA